MKQVVSPLISRVLNVTASKKGFRQGREQGREGGKLRSLRRTLKIVTPYCTLDAIRRLALALEVTTDELIFDKDERGPDEDLRLQFEAITRFTPEEKKIAKAVLESLILKHDASRFSIAG